MPPAPRHGGDELRELADDVLGGHGGDPDGLPALWSTVHGLGWTGVSVPEGSGGSGGTLTDLAALVRGLGRHGVSLPLAETVLAARQLAAAGRALPGESPPWSPAAGSRWPAGGCAARPPACRGPPPRGHCWCTRATTRSWCPPTTPASGSCPAATWPPSRATT
ncbi:acyl-CoA dehydrogenase family protein [Micromonospora sp. BRA006-A]|nr:acyl-CoA dehydrogenase family protein [Micromonospora sp. BRA006-A]